MCDYYIENKVLIDKDFELINKSINECNSAFCSTYSAKNIRKSANNLCFFCWVVKCT